LDPNDRLGASDITELADHKFFCGMNFFGDLNIICNEEPPPPGF